MIDRHYWPTPNGRKITIFLGEIGLPYRIVAMNLTAGEQFRQEFGAISPSNRMGAIVDHEPADGGAPLPGVRIRRDSLVSRQEDESVRSRRPARADADPAVAVLAGGRARADGRPQSALRAVCAGEATVRDRALQQGDSSLSMRCPSSVSPSSRTSPQSATRWPTSPAIPGSRPTNGCARTSRTSRT